jgi:hypothetical protein
VIVPPKATVPPPDNPEPALIVIDGVASMALVTPPVAMLTVPVFVIGPPVNPAPVATLVTVPPELGAEFVSVIVPPSATLPPPDNPAPGVTVIDGVASYTGSDAYRAGSSDWSSRQTSASGHAGDTA